ncbi:MAG: hypothetical protein AB7O65_06930 [Candidatus Korobacteraceae bacterium]
MNSFSRVVSLFTFYVALGSNLLAVVMMGTSGLLFGHSPLKLLITTVALLIVVDGAML